MLEKILRRPPAIDCFDYVVIGAGVIGLAVARQLALETRGSRSVVLLEREDGFGRHTSSRNSEVIHAGIYYPPGSNKAELCVSGRELLYEYCAKRGVSHARIGKLLVAQPHQLGELESIERRAIANGVADLRLVDRCLLQRIEPAVTASAALFSPSTGIVDSHGLMQALLDDAEAEGALFSRATRVEGVWAEDSGFTLSTSVSDGRSRRPYAMKARVVINCAGIWAQALSEMIAESASYAGLQAPAQRLSKGTYFDYAGANPFTHLIYPIPDATQDALGIHATIDLGGRLRFGPNAVPCSTLDYDVDDAEAPVFAASIQEYFPQLDPSKLSAAYAGIRPKLSVESGEASDFVIRREHEAGLPGLVSLYGIESPGLTSCLAIAQRVAGLVEDYEESFG